MVIIEVDQDTRIKVTAHGGLDIEVHVDGIGWMLANDAIITDFQISAVLCKAMEAIGKAKTGLGGTP